VSDVSESVSDFRPFGLIFSFSKNAIQTRKTVLLNAVNEAKFLVPAASTD
jgi:hypothetical protein